MKNRDANLFLAKVDENKSGRIGEGWTKIRGAQNKRGRKLKGRKLKGRKLKGRKVKGRKVQGTKNLRG